MGDGGHNEMDSWVQLLIYSIVSLGFVTSLQSFYITGRPRKQFELPFQQRIESYLVKRSVKIYCMSSSVIFIDSRYISLKGMICRIYSVKRRLGTHEMWTEQSQLRFYRNGPIRTITNIKNRTREIIVSETSQILQIFATQERKCRDLICAYSLENAHACIGCNALRPSTISREKARCFRSFWGKLKEDENNW